MSDLEKIPEKQKKWTEFQKDYNTTTKTFVHIIGTNISLFVCLLIPILLIGFIWTEFGALKIDVKFVSDGIVTVALFVIGEILMMRVGASGGKLDTEYTNAKNEYDRLVKEVNNLGTMFMSVFCEWQIDMEMAQATALRLRSLRITQEEWKRLKELPRKELKARYGRKKMRKILALNQLEPVELNDAILLFNGNDAFARGGVPISGEEYIDKKTHSAQMLISAIFTGLLTVSVALTLTTDISFARVMYTAFKLILLLFRMAQGYNIGATAYNTVEVKQLSAKNNYLRQYIRFIVDKTYLKLEDRYGDISCFVDVSKEEILPENKSVSDFSSMEEYDTRMTQNCLEV